MYEGEFTAGKKNGKGVKTWATGDVYEGEWVKAAACPPGHPSYCHYPLRYVCSDTLVL